MRHASAGGPGSFSSYAQERGDSRSRNQNRLSRRSDHRNMRGQGRRLPLQSSSYFPTRNRRSRNYFIPSYQQSQSVPMADQYLGPPQTQTNYNHNTNCSPSHTGLR